MPITVIGIGEEGVAGLASAARSLVETAEVVVGGARHLALLGDTSADRLCWPSPFEQGRALLEPQLNRTVVVLASGDPSWFGVATTLVRWFGASAVTVHPHPGAFSLAAARLLWPVQECRCLSIHGRPLEAVLLDAVPAARLLILAENGGSAQNVAALLTAHGLGSSSVWALEHLGGSAERIICGTAQEGMAETADLCVIAVEVKADPGHRVLGRGFGLPDDAFESDGQLTKREIRAVTLSSLAPWPGAVLWDIGAGSGSIAIEWMRAGGQAVALECDPARRARIARNALALGVPGLKIMAGRAPDDFPAADPAPDAVFVGGGVTTPGVLDGAWAALKSGGVLVANAVTIEGETALQVLHARHGGEVTRLSVSRLGAVGRYHTWSPAMPVTQYRGQKP